MFAKCTLKVRTPWRVHRDRPGIVEPGFADAVRGCTRDAFRDLLVESGRAWFVTSEGKRVEFDINVGKTWLSLRLASDWDGTQFGRLYVSYPGGVLRSPTIVMLSHYKKYLSQQTTVVLEHTDELEEGQSYCARRRKGTPARKMARTKWAYSRPGPEPPTDTDNSQTDEDTMTSFLKRMDNRPALALMNQRANEMINSLPRDMLKAVFEQAGLTLPDDVELGKRATV